MATVYVFPVSALIQGGIFHSLKIFCFFIFGIMMLCQGATSSLMHILGEIGKVCFLNNELPQ